MPEQSPDDSTEMDELDPSGRLAAYMARTQTPLDFVALATFWIVVVPPSDFGTAHDASTIALGVRIALSVVYGIDMAIRSLLARRHLHYVATHPVGVLVVVVPPARVIFSLRLIRSVFRRGHLGRFLLAAAVLVLEGAIVVYLFERHAHGSNIHTLGEAAWWSVVTVTTVGYGDYFPVTPQGRVTAVFIMFIGLLTLAVVTAQVAAMFTEQVSRRQGPETVQPLPASSGPPGDTGLMSETVTALEERLDRIERLVSTTAASIEAMSRQGSERTRSEDQDG